LIPLRDDVPSGTTPWVKYLFIAASVTAFLYVNSLPTERSAAAFFATFGAVPAALTGPEPAYLTVVTSMFLHGGWGHLIGNMWYLWIFGNNVEDAMGHGGFGLFYFLCGVAATVSQVLVEPGSRIPMVGASGAIAGVLGAYLVLFPSARVLAMVPLGIFTRILEVPAILFLVLWFLMQLVLGVSVLGAESRGGVAFWAHVGGFLAGLILVRLFARPRRR
jgi:membrane associated rhomboid family serine protease